MSDMELVFDVENNPIVIDHSEMDRSLDDINKQMFHELASFKENNGLENIKELDVEDEESFKSDEKEEEYDPER
jgi:hypothetical protein